MNRPEKIKQRKSLDAKLGIKSSLSDIRVAFATLYVLFRANSRKSQCFYSKQNGDEISLSTELANNIEKSFKNKGIIPLIENSPFFKSQFEPLYVYISLVYSLGVIKFNDNLSDSIERTANKRYAKNISFSANMLILDSVISAYSDEQIENFIGSWLDNKPCANLDLEQKITSILQILSEQTIFKLRLNEGGDLILQTECLYDAIKESTDQINVDSEEPVGPFRIIKSALEQGLNPYLQCKNKTVYLKPNIQFDDFLNYRNMVSTLLDISKRDSTISNKEMNKISSLEKDLSTKYKPFVAAIKTKPFILLAGISGTGKSKIVREMAKACWPVESEEYKSQKPRNYEMIPIRSNWHDSTELIGYYSSIQERYIPGPFLKAVVEAWKLTENFSEDGKEMPYFVCLDEMNLAPVEQYFAEYLSLIESREYKEGNYETDALIGCNEKGFEKLCDVLTGCDELQSEDTETKSGVIFEVDEPSHSKKRKATLKNEELRNMLLERGICLPPNLIVCGTVNMDETTHSFSRKVLDRAMTIEMNEVVLETGLDEGHPEEHFPHIEATDLLTNKIRPEDYHNSGEFTETIKDVLEWLTKINSVLNGSPFKIAYRSRNEILLYVIHSEELGVDRKRAFDEVVNMKILPRIEGDQKKVDDVLTKLMTVLKDEVGIVENSPSLEKLEEMERRMKNQYYCTYWN